MLSYVEKIHTNIYHHNTSVYLLNF